MFFYQMYTTRFGFKRVYLSFIMNDLTFLFREDIRHRQWHNWICSIIFYISNIFNVLNDEKGSVIVCQQCLPFDKFTLPAIKPMVYMYIIIIAIRRCNETNLFFKHLNSPMLFVIFLIVFHNLFSIFS